MTTTPGTTADVRAVFREAVRTDTVDIRELKGQVRTHQRAQSEDAPSMQRRLARLRRAARARHVAYSLWRGRCWAEVENNHPDGDPLLGYYVAEAWAEAAGAAGFSGAPPENLRVHIASFM